MEILQTPGFGIWLKALRDRDGRARIIRRIERAADGNFGDVKPVGGGVSEMRIQTGPGYRVYFMRRGPTVIVLLAGGDKASQAADIALARRLSMEWGARWTKC